MVLGLGFPLTKYELWRWHDDEDILKTMQNKAFSQLMFSGMGQHRLEVLRTHAKFGAKTQYPFWDQYKSQAEGYGAKYAVIRVEVGRGDTACVGIESFRSELL